MVRARLEQFPGTLPAADFEGHEIRRYDEKVRRDERDKQLIPDWT